MSLVLEQDERRAEEIMDRQLDAVKTLWQYVGMLDDSRYVSICAHVLCDPKFLNGYGSSNSDHEHHCYQCGLAVHTAEVLSYAVSLYNATPGCDYKTLITAAIWHDYYKIHDYEVDVSPFGFKVVKNKFGKLVGHVCGSSGEFLNYANMHGLSADERLAVQHCLLAHHGRTEWGSPVTPQTLEAEVLHYADMISMGYGKGRKL